MACLLSSWRLSWRTQARLCKLKDLKDELSCHDLLEGLDDKALKDKLFMKACSGALDFDVAVNMAKEHEVTKSHMTELKRGVMTAPSEYVSVNKVVDQGDHGDLRPKLSKLVKKIATIVRALMSGVVVQLLARDARFVGA